MKITVTTVATVLLLISAAAGRCDTHTVTDSADSGPGTLRQAILDANADGSPDLVTIEFNIPNAGVQTIAPLTPLPIITRPVKINGYTQPGTSSNTLANADNAALLIELSGTNVSSDYGLRFQANDCTVRGLVINGFAAQVAFESATNGVVEGNFLGTDATGLTTNMVSSANGVLIVGGAGHRVGGVTPAARNIVSGNWYVGLNVTACTGLQIFGNFFGITADGSSVLPSGYGIYLTDCSQTQIGGSTAEARNVMAGHSTGCWITGGESNVIRGNYFGTDASGMLRRTNTYYGVALQQSANNLVGGAVSGAGNLFSGNGTGIYLDGVGASNNVIAGNLIGPDATGTNALGNDYYGVAIISAPDNTVGGLTPGERNVIVGNSYAGIALSYATATGNVIQGNYIGVDITGTNALPNAGTGVATYDAPGNLIGGTSPGARNVIARNFHGILVSSGSNNVIQGNFIGTDATGMKGLGNEEHGIVLGADASGTLIGGSTPGVGNVIGTNGYDGISIGSPGTIVQGNIIGADVTGTNALFNGWSGIEIAASAPFTQVGGPGSAARNIITGNGGLGIYSSTNVIQGNYFGIGADGQTILGAPSFGITIDPAAEGNLVGGDGAGAGNLISGWFAGIRIGGSNNIVQGNLIGTDATGILARGNYYIALTIQGPNNLIGGLTTGARNLISGNSTGIIITGSAATGNTIQGNYIGTDITGTNALGNGSAGIGIELASANLIGGTDPAARNVIAGNGGWGLSFAYDGASNNVVQGNYFGLGADGITPVPNYTGMRIHSVPGNVIGGIAPGAGNWIAYNTVYGVSAIGDGATNNSFLGNAIFANGSAGIDLGEDGVTPNDPGDTDGSPNHFQNFPEIASPKLASGDLTVSYRVDSAPENSAYPLTVEFFLADSAASGQGKLLIYRHTYDTPQAFTNITFTPLAPVNDGDPMVATATDANGNTSEFSAVATASVNRGPVVSNPIPDQNALYGSVFTYQFPTNVFTDPDAGDALSYSATGLPPGLAFTPATRTFSGTPTNAGTFTVTVTATDDGIPALSTNEVFDVVVAKASLIVTANNKTKLPGQPNPPLDGTLVGVTNNDSIAVAFTTTADTGSPSGDYPITPILSDPDNRLPNYAVTTNAGTLTIVDCAAQAITNATLPSATEGAAYSVTLNAANGTSPYTFALTSGALPGNLTLSPDGLLSGTPTNTGNFPVTITVTGAVGCVTSSNYVLAVNCPAIAVFPMTAPNGTLSNFYTRTFTVKGGGSVNGFGISSGGLPAGLLLSSNGRLSGVPNAVGDYSFTISATNGSGCVGSQSYSMSVAPALAIGPATLPPASSQAAYSQALNASGGTGPYSFALVGGKLPAGISLSGSGNLSGTPLFAGTFTFTIGATDAASSSGATKYSLTVVGSGFQRLKSFGNPELMGHTPAAGLIEGTDGRLYGTTTEDFSLANIFGLEAGPGTVFAVNQDGSGFTVLHRFTGTNGDGQIPYAGLLEASDGMLYGTTFGGDSVGQGTVFKLNKNGSGYQVLKNFPAADYDPSTGVNTNSDGASPHAGALIEGSDGALYGTTTSGGTGGVGTVFKLNKNGGGFAVLHSFVLTGGDGQNPRSVIEASDGILYGTTLNGGISNSGTLFMLHKDGSGYAVLRSFTGTAGGGDGQNPRGVLLEASDGMLYGTTLSGGSSNNGTIFKLNKGGDGYAVIRSFGGDGATPFAGLTEGSDGALYGTTRSGGNPEPGYSPGGTVFKLNKDGTGYSILRSFPSGAGDGRIADGKLVQTAQGTLYGITLSGGGGGDSFGAGTVFRVGKDGSDYAVVWKFSSTGHDGQLPSDLIESTNGALFGITGGEIGTVYRVNKDGSDFLSLTQQFGLLSLMEGKDGVLYGNYGAYAGVFKVNKDGSGFAIYEFSPKILAYYPSGRLLEGQDGSLYGTTLQGGTFSFFDPGTVFSLNKNGSGLTVLADFLFRGFNPTVNLPNGVIQGRDGALYGTGSGGSDGAGAVFMLDTNGLSRTVIRSFSSIGGDAQDPRSLMEASDNMLYGTSYSGGSSNLGTIFKLNKDGTGYALVRSFTGAGGDGLNPSTPLVEAADGSLYGITYSGGRSNLGTLFKLQKNGTGYAVLWHFVGTAGDGSYPSALIAARDGAVYGTASRGGDLGLGILYRFVEPNGPPSLDRPITDQHGNYGSPFTFIIPANTFSDPDPGQALTYAASNLPAGISLDSSTRTFSGAPTNTGTFSVSVTATDNGTPALSTNDVFDFVVAKALLTVTANSTNRPYGVANPPLTGTLVGVTNTDNITAAFQTTADTHSPPGAYLITPILLDPDGRLSNYLITTNVGTLSVNGVTLEFSLSSGSPSFCWPTNAADFLLEYVDSLTPPINWRIVTNSFSTNGSTICVTATPTQATPTRFYRLHLP